MKGGPDPCQHFHGDLCGIVAMTIMTGMDMIMKNRLFGIIPLLLALLIMAACGRNTDKSASEGNLSEASDLNLGEEISEALSGTQDIPSLSDALLTEGWPHDLAPAELPEYTSGTVTASAVDGDGGLTIRVTDTSKEDLYAYLDELRQTGWTVTSDDTGAEAVLGLYTADLELQGGGSFLQIDLYTHEACSWPADAIPPDILQPGEGTLVEAVEVLETGENMWYFNYTFDGIDEAAAGEYMNRLMQSGWSGDVNQLYKAFEWNGKYYEATIEIYETVETRTTFTCNFYLSTKEPASPASSTQPSGDSIAGIWILGTMSGEELNSSSGRYEGGTSGMGQVYAFYGDGTYKALVIWSEALYFTGQYSVSEGVLALTGRAVEESMDGGKTWGTPEALPDTSAPFAVGTDDTGAYLLLGEEGAALPLVEKTNAMKYRLKD